MNVEFDLFHSRIVSDPDLLKAEQIAMMEVLDSEYLNRKMVVIRTGAGDFSRYSNGQTLDSNLEVYPCTVFLELDSKGNW